jgi:hypothetical protein
LRSLDLSGIPGWRSELGPDHNNLSDRVHSEYRMTFILKGRVRGRQERQMGYCIWEDKDQTDGDMYY